MWFSFSWSCFFILLFLPHFFRFRIADPFYLETPKKVWKYIRHRKLDMTYSSEELKPDLTHHGQASNTSLACLMSWTMILGNLKKVPFFRKLISFSDWISLCWSNDSDLSGIGCARSEKQGRDFAILQTCIIVGGLLAWGQCSQLMWSALNCK